MKYIREYEVTIENGKQVEEDLDALSKVLKYEGLYVDLIDAFTRYADIGDEGELYLYSFHAFGSLEGDPRIEHAWGDFNDAVDSDPGIVYGPVKGMAKEMGVTVSE